MKCLGWQSKKDGLVKLVDKEKPTIINPRDAAGKAAR